MPTKILKDLSKYLLKNIDSKVCIDSRLLNKGDVFIALKGEQQHGNDYIEECIKRKASFIISDSKVKYKKHTSVHSTKDPQKLLWDLAELIRSQSDATFIAITGSNGKTTTKDITHCLLNKGNDTLKTQGNFNNLLGVPLTLCSLKPHHVNAVIECGTNQPGEIEQLCALIKPKLSVITSINAAHLSGLKNVQGIAKEKSEIFKNFPEYLILRKKDTEYSSIKNTLRDKNHTFFDLESDLNIIKSLSKSNSLTWLYKKQKLVLNSPALHNALNAQAAIKIAEYLNIPLKIIATRLKNWHADNHRMCMTQWKKRNIIDDCYNANPASVMEAVKTAAGIKKKPKQHFFMVFGNMNEMGSRSNAHHKNLGKVFAEKGVDVLLTLGDKAKMSILPYSKNGGKSSRHFDDIGEIVNFLKVFTQPHDVILIKGSRSMKMENILDDISTKTAS
jgi:UDP-N-acetylmuramoyl-tripeptide--D-alanyl-D-alanine ligase